VLRELRAKLSEPSGRAWDRLLTNEGITASGLVEAMGRLMAEGRWKPSAEMLRLTREIDRERRSR
jgi:hypothetical protein